MIRTEDPSATHTFDAGDVQVYVAAPSKLALYDHDNDRAWLAADRPADLHDWR